MKEVIFITFVAFAIIGGLWLTKFSSIASAEGLLIKGDDLMKEKPSGYPTAIFGGGCFWCIESEFRALNGVVFTQVGYMGGDLNRPSYRDITTGKTGHAEVVEVTYDPKQVSYEQLVEFFLTQAHDPTQLNRQGVDKGTQYRSSIFYQDDEQLSAAQKVIAYVDGSNMYRNPIVTKLEPAQEFWVGEEYHQQYYEKYKQGNGIDHIRVIMKKGGKL